MFDSIDSCSMAFSDYKKLPFSPVTKTLLTFIRTLCRLLDIDPPEIDFSDDTDPDAEPVKAAAGYVLKTNTLLIRTAYMTEENCELVQYAAARELCMMWQYQQEGINYDDTEYPDDCPISSWCEEWCADCMATALMTFFYGTSDWYRWGIIRTNGEYWYEFYEETDLIAAELEKTRSDRKYRLRLKNIQSYYGR